MEIAGYIAALLIGISLGMIGGGGSILTVPVLVYLMNVNPLLATTYSLFIVGSSSLTGGIRAYTKDQVDFKAITEFGFPSIFSVFIARHYLLPLIPSHIFNAGHFELTRDRLLMLVFSLLMFVTSFLIITDKTNDLKEELIKAVRHNKSFELALAGLVVGLITGILGAGGGFLIVPILVLYIRLPMKTAVGTSLMIIAINSLFGFLFSLKQFSFDWKILIIFSVISIAGIFIGSRLAQKFSGAALKKIFGWFILIVAIGILLRELIFTPQ
ncbi:MAG: sulfite exporter TauE/SafE family protein [Bacteroidota bacterium]